MREIPLFDRSTLVAADLGVGLVYTFVVASQGPQTAMWWLTAAIGLPVALRRVWPVPTLLVVAAASVTALLLGELRDPFLATAFVLYTVCVTRRGSFPTRGLLTVVSTAGVIAFGLAVVGLTPARSVPIDRIVTGASVLLFTWAIGDTIRERRVAAARTLEQVAAQAVYEERLRIAREMHDIVAHSMGLIAVKAGVANHVVTARPEEAADALSAIEETSRKALTELRDMLNLLRTPGQAAVPLGGLAALPELVERVRSTGVEVQLRVAPTELPAGVELAVHRIVQECLTNVAKHGRASHCEVVVDAAPGTVRVEVTNDGVAGAPNPEGHGLVGVRERAEVYHGSFEAGPRPSGGFRVAVELPYGASA